MQAPTGRPLIARLLPTAVLVASFALLVLGTPDVQGYLRNSDHGLQLAIGEQIRQGRVPGVDVYFQYGPGAGYASAVALMLSGSMLGETLVCAFGYAVTLTLLYWLVRRACSTTGALLSTVAGYVLLARFYKWYVWLAPLLLLWLWHRLDMRRDQASAATLGLGLGVMSLFRWDFGVTGIAALVLAVLLFPAANTHRATRLVLLIVVGYALPNLLWLVVVSALYSPAAAAHSLGALVGGSARMASEMGVSLPRPSLQFPLSQPARLAPAFWAMPLLYLAAAGFAVVRQRSGHGDSRSRLVGVAALLGASVLHQAFYRSDPQHVLQVLPPALVLVPLLVAQLWRGVGSLGRWTSRAAAAVLLMLAIGCGALLVPYGRTDLESPLDAPGARLRGLAHAFTDELPGPFGRLVSELRRQTAPGDPILLYPLLSQLYPFVQRPVAGKLVAYYPSFFDLGSWRRENLEALASSPPVRVAVPKDLFSPQEPVGSLRQLARRAHPEVDALILGGYPAITYENRLFRILGPKGTSPPPKPPRNRPRRRTRAGGDGARDSSESSTGSPRGNRP